MSNAKATPVPDKRLRRIAALAHLLDDSIRIPILGYRIGWEAVVGLLPGIGDLVGLILSAYLIIQASRFALPATTLVRMVLNVVFETLVGLVPVLGDVFDAAYKANLRNLDLLHRHLGTERARPRRDDRRLVVGVVLGIGFVVLVVLGLLGLLVWGLVALLGG